MRNDKLKKMDEKFELFPALVFPELAEAFRKLIPVLQEHQERMAILDQHLKCVNELFNMTERFPFLKDVDSFAFTKVLKTENGHIPRIIGGGYTSDHYQSFVSESTFVRKPTIINIEII